MQYEKTIKVPHMDVDTQGKTEFLQQFIDTEDRGGTFLKITQVTSYVFKAEDLVVAELPKTCGACPVGFHTNPNVSCGRNIPFTSSDFETRPETCKMKTLEEFLKNEGRVL